MTKGRPFYFDSNVFDAVEEPQPEDLENAPKYTDDQLALARSAAFNDGKRAGLAEAQSGIEKEIQQILVKIDDHIAKLFAVESVRYERYEAEAVHLSYHIIRKIFPLLFNQIGEEHLQQLIANVIAEQKSIADMHITVHSDIAPTLDQYLDKLPERLAKSVKVIPSSTLPRNDCNIGWDYGGAILAPEKTAAKILALLQETLADQGINVHDTQSENPDDITGDADE